MSDRELDEMYGDAATTTPVAETPPVESVVAPPVESTPASEAPPVVAEATPESAQQPPEHSVPLNVLLRTREEFGGKLSAAERELATLRAEKIDRERKAREAAETIPHPLDDPDGFAAGIQRYAQSLVQKAVAPLSQRQAADREEISRIMVEQHLGPEKFAELSEAISHAPQWLHDKAMQQPHPWGFMLQEFNRVKEQKRAQEALNKLGGKTLEERIEEARAEAVAEARAKWEAERGGGQPQPVAQPAIDARARNADGTFAPSQPEQRHRPESLSKMNGAAVIAPASAGSALDELYG